MKKENGERELKSWRKDSGAGNISSVTSHVDYEGSNVWFLLVMLTRWWWFLTSDSMQTRKFCSAAQLPITFLTLYPQNSALFLWFHFKLQLVLHTHTHTPLIIKLQTAPNKTSDICVVQISYFNRLVPTSSQCVFMFARLNSAFLAESAQIIWISGWMHECGLHPHQQKLKTCYSKSWTK